MKDQITGTHLGKIREIRKEGVDVFPFSIKEVILDNIPDVLTNTYLYEPHDKPCLLCTQFAKKQDGRVTRKEKTLVNGRLVVT